MSVLSGRQASTYRQSSVLFLSTTAVLLVASTVVANETITPQPRTGDPLDGLSSEQLDRFFQGKDAFENPFEAETGLGPVFNDNSCSSCHNEPAVGGAGTITVTRFGRLIGSDFDPLEEYGGSLLQAEVITVPDVDTDLCKEVIPWEDEGWRDGANHSAKRVTNAVFGSGLVEAIPDDDILANLANGGAAHMVQEIEHPDFPDAPADRVGRMGWKAQLATTLSFSADASLMEQGLTSYLLQDPVAPNNDQSLMDFCDQWGPEHPQDQPELFDGEPFIDRITDFQRFLAPPPQTPRDGMTGEEIFTNIGCADCHVPAYITSDSTELEEALREREIKPYSDFLLHDMGLAGDFIEQGAAGLREIRTPSLWGVRDRPALLHDGSADSGNFATRIAQVIDAHGATLSSAGESADAFEELSEGEQTLVINFLDSLGRAEFDAFGNLLVLDDDFVELVACYTGPGEPYKPDGWGVGEGDPFEDVSEDFLDENGNLSPMDHPCAIFDFNQDGSIDEADFEWFVAVYDGNLEPCELWLDLQAAVGPDIEVDVPGECLDDCPWDLAGDGEVGVSDMLALLASWGPCADPDDCPADFNGDGLVDVSDLLILLQNWGPCP